MISHKQRLIKNTIISQTQKIQDQIVKINLSALKIISSIQLFKISIKIYDKFNIIHTQLDLNELTSRVKKSFS